MVSALVGTICGFAAPTVARAVAAADCAARFVQPVKGMRLVARALAGKLHRTAPFTLCEIYAVCE